MKKIVIIDVGHGGSDPGASGNGVVEKVANLETALSLKNKLQSLGITVYITRTTDVSLTLSERCVFANNIAKNNPGASIVFISIHHNAGGGDRGEVIHSIYRGDGQELANIIGDELQKHLGQQKKVYEKKGSDNKDYYYVIRNTSMSAIIIEVAFLDNINDVQICDSPEEQRRNGEVIACGVAKFFNLTSSCLNDSCYNKPTETPSTSSYTVKITADVLNVRTGPSTSYAVATTIKKNEVYTIVEENNGWGKLKSGAGWISLNYTSKNSTITSTPPPSTSINAGDKVIITGSKYATGETIPSWAKGVPFTVQQLGSKGALIKELISWVNIADLRRV